MILLMAPPGSGKSTLGNELNRQGIAGRDFIDEMCSQYRVLFVKLGTPRELCLERVRNRPKGRNINPDTEAFVGKFYDDWHSNVAPTYDFGLSVSGTDLVADASLVRREIAKDCV